MAIRTTWLLCLSHLLAKAAADSVVQTAAPAPTMFTNETVTATSAALPKCTGLPVVKKADCWVDGPFGRILGWWDSVDYLDLGQGHGRQGFVKTLTARATIITAVDTRLNATTVRTIMPPDWTPPATNAQGTRVQSVTLWPGNTPSMTTIAFPTPFVLWPKSYIYMAGISGKDCLPVDVTVTSTIAKPTPQFRKGDKFNFKKGEVGDTSSFVDPKGLFAGEARIDGRGAWPMALLPDMWPDDPALRCDNYPPGPDYGGSMTDWQIVTATQYV